MNSAIVAIVTSPCMASTAGLPACQSRSERRERAGIGGALIIAATGASARGQYNECRYVGAARASAGSARSQRAGEVFPVASSNQSQASPSIKAPWQTM